jgi:hypothetical protein
MEYGALAIIAVFLPFFVSLSGSNSVWKFLSFLFCILSVFGALAFFVPGLVCWIIAWIFAGVSFGSRRPTPAATPAIQETQSPARPFRSALGFVLGCAALIGVIVLWSQRNGINAERATFAPSSVTALTINPRETSAPTETENVVKDITETAFVVAQPPPAATMLPPWAGAKDELASVARPPTQVKATVPIPRPRPRIAP